MGRGMRHRTWERIKFVSFIVLIPMVVWIVLILYGMRGD